MWHYKHFLKYSTQDIQHLGFVILYNLSCLMKMLSIRFPLLFFCHLFSLVFYSLTKLVIQALCKYIKPIEKNKEQCMLWALQS